MWAWSDDFLVTWEGLSLDISIFAVERISEQIITVFGLWADIRLVREGLDVIMLG